MIMEKKLKIVKGTKRKKEKTKKQVIDDNIKFAIMLKTSNTLLGNIHAKTEERIAQEKLVLPTENLKCLQEISLMTAAFREYANGQHS